MGWRNKKYKMDLHRQAFNRLNSMLSFGESKREARQRMETDDKIFSISTYETYWKHIKYFIKWINVNHPECTTLKGARKYVNVWLKERVEQVNYCPAD